jgi:shikimate 5-dehydrogenase
MVPRREWPVSSRCRCRKRCWKPSAITHVADVVTAPIITPLLAFARDRGCAIQTGPEMALAQMKLMGQFIGAIAQEQGAAA